MSVLQLYTVGKDGFEDAVSRSKPSKAPSVTLA